VRVRESCGAGAQFPGVDSGEDSVAMAVAATLQLASRVGPTYALLLAASLVAWPREKTLKGPRFRNRVCMATFRGSRSCLWL
jgi:hypothetical protein